MVPDVFGVKSEVPSVAELEVSESKVVVPSKAVPVWDKGTDGQNHHPLGFEIEGLTRYTRIARYRTHNLSGLTCWRSR